MNQTPPQPGQTTTPVVASAVTFTSLNPYRDLNPRDPKGLKICNDVLRTDAYRIRSVCMDYGFLNTAVSLFIKHLYNHCEHNQYTINNRPELIAHVLAICGDGADTTNLTGTNVTSDGSLTAVASGPAPSRPSGPGPQSNERVGPLPVDSSNQGTQDVKRPRTRKQTGETNK